MLLRPPTITCTRLSPPVASFYAPVVREKASLSLPRLTKPPAIETRTLGIIKLMGNRRFFRISTKHDRRDFPMTKKQLKYSTKQLLC